MILMWGKLGRLCVGLYRKDLNGLSDRWMAFFCRTPLDFTLKWNVIYMPSTDMCHCLPSLCHSLSSMCHCLCANPFYFYVLNGEAVVIVRVTV